MYSTKKVAIRELLQNSHDSCIRRHAEGDGEDYEPRVDVTIDAEAQKRARARAPKEYENRPFHGPFGTTSEKWSSMFLKEDNPITEITRPKLMTHIVICSRLKPVC